MPEIFNPYAPQPGGWFQPSAPVSADPRGTLPGDTAANAPRPPSPYRITAGGGVFRKPDEMSDADADELVRRWNEHVATLEADANESTGYERMLKERELADAKEGRDNALKIARMSNTTSRYGTDVNAATQLRDLKERQRQYDLTHGLDVQRLGLDRAKTATDYLSTADRFVQAGDYLNLSGNVLAGVPGVGTYGQGGRAQPKTMADFNALEAGGNPGRQLGQDGGAGGAGADPRTKAIQGLMKAYTPSDGLGHDQNDYAVLGATKAIMGLGGLTPQQQASIRSSPQYQKVLGSAARRLGDDPEEWWAQQQRGLPGQGSVRAA